MASTSATALDDIVLYISTTTTNTCSLLIFTLICRQTHRMYVSRDHFIWLFQCQIVYVKRKFRFFLMVRFRVNICKLFTVFFFFLFIVDFFSLFGSIFSVF